MRNIEYKKSLAFCCPDLAREWHPEKNGDLTPDKVSAGSNRVVWWSLSYDDPATGKLFLFEWKARIAHRRNGIGCPFLSGHAVWPGFNDLATRNEKLAKEWHPTKNGTLTPKDVPANSRKKVWWLFCYDDPRTGKHFEFEWEACIYNRNLGEDCPFLSSHKLWVGFNDLATRNEKLAKEWHPNKNGMLTPKDVTASSNRMVWWYLPYDDPETGKHFEFEWKASVSNRNHGDGCPYISKRRSPTGIEREMATRQKLLVGFNDLATRNEKLAREWHPTKNGTLTPKDVTVNSKTRVWWLFLYDDPVTGKHFEFEWKASISTRNKELKCPFLTSNAVWPGFNDLATVNSKLAKEWHPTRNGALTPKDVTVNSGLKVWWLFPYDDPVTGKHFDFEWKAVIKNRNHQGGCPFLTNNAVWPGFNDLATRNEKLAKEWHPTKNGTLTPKDVSANSQKKVWWLFRYDDPRTGKHFDLEWRASINNRTRGDGCPFLYGKAILQGFNDIKSRCEYLMEDWNWKKNDHISPEKVYYKTSSKVWWKCHICNYEWRTSVYIRSCQGSGCPDCEKNRRD